MNTRYLCQICMANEATMAMQYVASERPSFSTLGSHYRGFPVTKVCDDCCDRILEGDREAHTTKDAS